MRRRIALGVAAFAYVCALALVTARRGAGDRAAAAGRQAPARAAAPVPPAPPTADYVGSDTCLGCHDDAAKHLASDAALEEGQPAIAGGGQGMRELSRARLAPRRGSRRRHHHPQVPEDVAARGQRHLPVLPHERAARLVGGQPARRPQPVLHHLPQRPQPRGGTSAAEDGRRPSLCAGCHRTQVLKMSRVSHMPVARRKDGVLVVPQPARHRPTSVCSRSATGSTRAACRATPRNAARSCSSTPPAARAASRCHDPHGSSNDRMLVARPPMLCQRCHIGTRHPSTIYDSAVDSGPAATG